MNQLQLFLPCAAGVEDLLADEVHRLTGLAGDDLLVGRGGLDLPDDAVRRVAVHRPAAEPAQPGAEEGNAEQAVLGHGLAGRLVL